MKIKNSLLINWEIMYDPDTTAPTWVSLRPLLAVVRRCRHSSKRFTLHPRSASPPGLVQTVLVSVNKIVVFVDNKSREGAYGVLFIWTTPSGICSLNRQRRQRRRRRFITTRSLGTFFRFARKLGSFPRQRPRVPGIRETQIGSDAIAGLFFERRAWARDPFERILLFLTQAQRVMNRSVLPPATEITRLKTCIFITYYIL